MRNVATKLAFQNDVGHGEGIIKAARNLKDRTGVRFGIIAPRSNSPALELNGSRSAAAGAGEAMICLQPGDRFSILVAALWAVERDLSIAELGLRCRATIQGDPNEEVAQEIPQHRVTSSRWKLNMIQ
jgi:hypothetical protein